jgi:NTP pyrophosphatase (non-canonical NTP hydrolase)
MKPPDTQARVAEFVERHGLEIPVAFRALDLMAETGEFAKEILKSTSYGRASLQNNAALQDELADTAFALICIANSLGIDLDEAVTRALQKYEIRLEVRGDAGSGE